MKMSSVIKKFVIILMSTCVASIAEAYVSNINFDNGATAIGITSPSGAKYPLTLGVVTNNSNTGGAFTIALNIANVSDSGGKVSNIGADAQFSVGSTVLHSTCTSVTAFFTADFLIDMPVDVIRNLYSQHPSGGAIVVPITVNCALTGSDGKQLGTADIFSFNLVMTFSISMGLSMRSINFDYPTSTPWSSSKTLCAYYESLIPYAKCTITSANNFTLLPTRSDNPDLVPYGISVPGVVLNSADNQRCFRIQEGTQTQIILFIDNFPTIPVSGKYVDVLNISVSPED